MALYGFWKFFRYVEKPLELKRGKPIGLFLGIRKVGEHSYRV
jgi:hypothetical protein